MSQDLFDMHDWTAIEDEVSGDAVAKDMGSYLLGDSRFFPVALEKPPDVFR